MSVPSESRRINRSHIIRVVVVLLAFVVIGIWLIATPDGLLGKADAVGYAVCHRIDLRSFHLGDRQLPLCSRCSGTFLGALGALLYLSVVKRKAALFPPRHLLIPIGIVVLVYAIDGLNSTFHLLPFTPHVYPPHNTLRLITGTFFGIVVASFTFTVVNQSLWYEPERKPALRSLGDLTILLAIGVGIVLAVLSDNPLILYPLAVMSTIGVLALLTVVYSMLLLIILRRENRARRMRDLAFIFIAGLTLAVAQIALIDFLRYAVVGTWEGFHF